MKLLRSLLLSALLTLSVTGAVQAANITSFFEPQQGIAEVWTTEVFFNYDVSLTESLSAGDLVVWDIGSSTGDDNNWVVATSTADTFLVAGVVYPAAIGSGLAGSIAIRGIVDVDVNGPVQVGDLLCSSTTLGEADNCSDAADDINAFGFATEAGEDTAIKVYLFSR